MKKQFIITLFFLSSAINQLDAQETLEEIQVLSSSKLINNKLSGGTTHIITKNDIENYPGETLPQIISRLPGIEFKDLYGSGFGAYQSIDMRGFADTEHGTAPLLQRTASGRIFFGRHDGKSSS